MRTWSLVAALVIVPTVIAPTAFAQTGPIIAYPPQNDTVSMSLSAEDWVETQTARTELSVDVSLPGADAGKARGDVLSAVKALAQGADWRFTMFNRNQEASGLEHWHAVLEARLTDAQLGGLADRAKQASKPGLQIAVQNTDFSPTLAETEAVRAKVRAELYKKINEALAQLNQAEPDRKFRVMDVSIEEGVDAAPRAMNKMAAAAAPMSRGLNEVVDIQRSERVQMSAGVTFAALAPRE
jgi:hypothetical protein